MVAATTSVRTSYKYFLQDNDLSEIPIRIVHAQLSFVFQNGFAVDPAAVTYLKQIKAYEEWALRQQENNKKIIG